MPAFKNGADYPVTFQRPGVREFVVAAPGVPFDLEASEVESVGEQFPVGCLVECSDNHIENPPPIYIPSEPVSTQPPAATPAGAAPTETETGGSNPGASSQETGQPTAAPGESEHPPANESPAFPRQT